MKPSAIEPQKAIARLAARIAPVGVESVTIGSAAGRVLADELKLDRDSPACDVSAMDGFAVRHAELARGATPVVGECRIGEPPESLPTGAAMRIYTGSPLPNGADTVVRLERVTEADDEIALIEGSEFHPGDDIRRRGENALAGTTVLAPGVELAAAAIGAVATVGLADVTVYRRLRITVITTGNELDRSGSAELPPWRLRDSNGPALAAMFAGTPWVQSVKLSDSADSLETLTTTLTEALADADAVVLTGGVSKGAYDFVPEAVRKAGGEVVFHRVRARPGQPTLGAVADGKLIVGLPGNPLAVLTAGRRLLAPLLRRMAGFKTYDPPASLVTLEAWAGKPQSLTWWRPVSLTAPGVARLAALQGSGDVFGPAMADGFVEIAPDADGVGPFPFYTWRP